MLLTATDVTRSMVFVCLCVGHSAVQYKNGWSDRDAVWGGADSCGPRIHVLDGVEIPHWKGQFLGFVQPS